MLPIIKDTDFIEIARSVKPDAKKRVVLHKAALDEGITYHMYQNRIGQIILDPQVSVPVSEAWLFKNPDAISSVRRGLADAAKGRVSKVNAKDM